MPCLLFLKSTECNRTGVFQTPPPTKAPLIPPSHLLTLFFHLECPSLQHSQPSTSESPAKKCCVSHESILEMPSGETTLTVCLSHTVTGLIPTHRLHANQGPMEQREESDSSVKSMWVWISSLSLLALWSQENHSDALSLCVLIN